MTKHDNSKLKIDGAEVHASGLCAEGEANGCDHRAPDRAQVDICKRWLAKYATHRKTMNRYSNSYSLKHQVEMTRLREHGGDYYVSNGSLIAAALALGYQCRRIRGTPNAIFAMKLLAES